MKRRSKGILKRSRRRRSKPKSNPSNKITTIEQFYALPERDQELLLLLPKPVSLMKENDISASAAARASWIPPRDFISRARSALRKLKNGRYVAKSDDHLFRPVIVVSSNGPVEVATRSFREASKAGQHSSAVQRYLETGDDSALRPFKGKHITDAQGNRVPLLTDTDELDELGSVGELSFESLYLRSR